jgi:hypothetical protein
MSGEAKKKESLIIIHLDREVDDQLLEAMTQSVIAFMNRRWPIEANWQLPS